MFLFKFLEKAETALGEKKHDFNKHFWKKIFYVPILYLMLYIDIDIEIKIENICRWYKTDKLVGMYLSIYLSLIIIYIIYRLSIQYSIIEKMNIYGMSVICHWYILSHRIAHKPSQKSFKLQKHVGIMGNTKWSSSVT